MLVSVQNLTSSSLSCDAGLLQRFQTKTVSMSAVQLYMASANLQSLETAGYISVSVVEETAANLAAALATSTSTSPLGPSKSYPARDPNVDSSATFGLTGAGPTVADVNGLSTSMVLSKVIPATATSTAGDAIFYATGSIPFNMRLLDVQFDIETAVSGKTVQLWTAASGAGIQLTQAASCTSQALLRNTQAAANASLLVGSTTGGSGVTFTAVNLGVGANSITIQYLAPAGGATTVAVTGNAIVVSPQTSGTNAQVVTAIGLSTAASALVTCVSTGTSSDVVVTTAATPLAGGINGSTLLTPAMGLYVHLSALTVGVRVTCLLRRE